MQFVNNKFNGKKSQPELVNKKSFESYEKNIDS